MAKNIANEVLVSALISHSSIREAAEEVGLTERAVYDRMKTPEFKELYKKVRDNLLNAATARLQNIANSAISTLETVMKNETAASQVRVNAAMAALQYCLRFTEDTDWRERIEALESGGTDEDQAAEDDLSRSLAELALTLESDN